ncbi:MAG: hypothetical protein M3Q66_02325 [Chloroflexota bacterium]|nr:hypothetical protein [Chloroflexota bacterium]
MALLAPIAVLIVVVGLGVAGRIASDPTAPPPSSAPVAVAVAPARTPLATLDPDARPTVIPFLPLMPFVADRRETGTDGLMGRLPFDLPPDPVAPRVNRFTIDDVVATWAAWDTTPPWVRRLGALSGYRTDPYQR